MKRFKIVVVRYNETEMEFDMKGIHPALVNSFRRLILSDVPSMAIEQVHMYNTSLIQDEVLAHRLGLIPLKADPRMFEFRTEESKDFTEQDSLEFELKIKCTMNKDGFKDASCADDLYKNNKGENHLCIL